MIIAFAPIDAVIAAAAQQNIVSGIAINGIGIAIGEVVADNVGISAIGRHHNTKITQNNVKSVVPGQGIGTCAAHDDIIAKTASNNVLATNGFVSGFGPADAGHFVARDSSNITQQSVIALAAINGVIAATAHDNVIATISIDQVGTAIAAVTTGNRGTKTG